MAQSENPAQRFEHVNDVTTEILDAAIEVHRFLGAGALESAYSLCLTQELRLRSLVVRTQVPLPLVYKGIRVDAGYRLDMLVEERVVVELKAVDRIAPVHHAQLISYLRLSGHKVGLLLTFNVPRMIDGVVRHVNRL